MIMVDELVEWPGVAKSGRRWFGEGKKSCHLTTDGPIDELHAFAEKIGLKRAWFQEHVSAPHYDLTPSRREKAIAAGAVFVSAREQSKQRLARKQGSIAEGRTLSDPMRPRREWECLSCGTTFEHRDTDCAACGGDTFVEITPRPPEQALHQRRTDKQGEHR